MPMSTSPAESHPRPAMRGGGGAHQRGGHLSGDPDDAPRLERGQGGCPPGRSGVPGGDPGDVGRPHRGSPWPELQKRSDSEVAQSRVTVDTGGTGSTPAGDSCRGAFTLDGHRYTEPIPQTAQHSAGRWFRAVVVPGDPALLSPTQVLAHEHSSWPRFVLPVILFVVLLLLVVGLLVVQRRKGNPKVPVSTA
jgi:hypothetical protein